MRSGRGGNAMRQADSRDEFSSKQNRRAVDPDEDLQVTSLADEGEYIITAKPTRRQRDYPL
jgi:hypothetical protein